MFKYLDRNYWAARKRAKMSDRLVPNWYRLPFYQACVDADPVPATKRYMLLEIEKRLSRDMTEQMNLY